MTWRWCIRNKDSLNFSYRWQASPESLLSGFIFKSGISHGSRDVTIRYNSFPRRSVKPLLSCNWSASGSRKSCHRVKEFLGDSILRCYFTIVPDIRGIFFVFYKLLCFLSRVPWIITYLQSLLPSNRTKLDLSTLINLRSTWNMNFIRRSRYARVVRV